MTRDHARIEELLAVRALGGLDGTDAQALDELLAEHGECRECLRIQREFDEVAGALALALEPVPVPSEIGDRILEETARVEAGRTPHAMRRWVAVGVAAVLAMGVAAVGTLRSRPTDVTLAAGQTFTRFEAADAPGSLTLAHTPGEPGAVFWGDGLLQPGPGKVLEIWMIADEAPVSGGCVRPTPDGRLALFVDASLDEAEVMAVTVEDASCPSAPTTDPVYVAELR
jgi:anti-sigma-K factor RskA